MKNFRLLSVILLIGIFLVGCSSGNSSQSSAGGTESKGGNESDEKLSGEITVWAHPYTGDQEVEGKMWDEIISSFEEETGVKVNFEQIPWANRDQKILTALVANNGPDVFYAIPDQMPQYADEGMLLELDPYLEDLDMDDFVDTALVSTTWKDKLYGLPILQEAYTFFYNVDIVKDIGEDPENLPKTWEEFDEWAKKAKDKGYYAMSFAGGGSMNGTLYPYVWQAGGDIVNEDNEVLINNEKSLKAWERLNNMYKEGWIPEDSITAMEHDALWDSGKMLAVQGSGTSVTNLLSKDLFDFVIAPPLKGEEQVTYGTTGMFVAPVNTDNPAAAAEFIKVMTNTENQKRFNKVTQYIPTRESAKEIFDDEPYLSQLATYTQYALPGVIHPAGRTIMPFIQSELQTMMEGKKTPQEAADAAAEAIQLELDKK
ncbi:sugar ABC transporter substrate-binding protein [Lederbergia galactosidilytica]|uniref:ABC transporter substrate-binding protein n=1 Tax=Lederbergia galactosidilytica TaxID=217031 RepID=A0A177ZH19_9BACI|nr:sugar ABC transporter substrate-binding protein [Lederbergia galactosidilytica]KRG16386.1 ABC transporter substrate-binding protein [Virgibacillus soli]MBP1914294.1 multiple sugar transport system substrate-binding protein [Lederbergia galactosidilytica]OAK67267.1 ABC transporter substrate-binding protein [Lederbergia galactosidilytica]